MSDTSSHHSELEANQARSWPSDLDDLTCEPEFERLNLRDDQARNTELKQNIFRCLQLLERNARACRAALDVDLARLEYPHPPSFFSVGFQEIFRHLGRLKQALDTYSDASNIPRNQFVIRYGHAAPAAPVYTPLP